MLYQRPLKDRKSSHCSSDSSVESHPNPSFVTSRRVPIYPFSAISFSNVNMSNESLPSSSCEASREEEDAEVRQFARADVPQSDQLQRQDSLVSRVLTKFSFLSGRIVKSRRSIYWQTTRIYLIMGVFVLAVFSIYWGSYYDRPSRYKNLRMLVVIEDDQTIDGIDPWIGNFLREILETPQAKTIGNWLVQNNTAFSQLAASNNNTAFEEVQKQVHDQQYWLSIYVWPNATYNFFKAIQSGDTSYNVSYNSIVSYYETGRDINAMGSYVTPQVNKINEAFLQKQGSIVEHMMEGQDTAQIFGILDAVKVAASSLEFFEIDGIPFTDPVILASAQVGLIYMIILTFFSFNFFSSVYTLAGKMNLKNSHMITYRVGSAIVSFLVLSFFFSLLSLAFQVDFTQAFGKGGWPIYWATNFLTMWAVGGINEAVAMVLILIYPPMVGFWLLFWVVTNISATFAPIVLTPNFYRYSYGMPIHAASEITKVILFNTYRGTLGRNYGILMAWVVIATVALLFLAINFCKTMDKRMAKEKKRQEEEILSRFQNEKGGTIDLNA